jgi:glycosyltransferase involved in cell wall biosynthesis
MNETSLQVEYQKLCPGITKVFVVPKIPQKNKDTSYLYQFYKSFHEDSSSQIKIKTFNAALLPLIFLNRIKFEKSILHYHWFEFEDAKSFIGIKWKLFWIIIYKMLGGKIIWTVHNKYPHHNKYLFLNKKVRRLLAKIANRLHIHCESAINTCAGVLGVPEDKFFVVRHPVFSSTIIERDKAIEELNKKYLSGKIKPGDKVFLMFGAIAEYKGIKEVINIFRRLDKRNRLLIAGFIKIRNEKYFNELQLISDKENIFVIGDMIPDEDVPYFFNSSDCTIFNYRDVLTSGGVHLSLAYKKPVIAPLSGCLKELHNDVVNFFETTGDRNKNLHNIIKKFTY